MRVIEVKSKKGQKKFLDFRKKIYQSNPVFVDNHMFMLKMLFANKTCFSNNKKIYVVNVEDDGKVLCQGLIIHAQELAEYIQLCFFESKANQEKAVELLVDKAVEVGKRYHCKKLVVGLNGHLNYGLGLLNSHYDEKNSFSASANPKYYNDYFKKMNFEEVHLKTYKIDRIDDRLKVYEGIIDRLNKKYRFEYFDKKNFDYYSKIYTDLNNQCFMNHRYYYKRGYEEDKEMLKELFLFMKNDSLIFVFDGKEPVGFTLWYQDYNELVKKGDAFGTKHYFKNKLFNKKIKKAKVMEIALLEDYRKIGLPLGLLNQIKLCLDRYKIKSLETSWVLEENYVSNSVCKAICDEEYKRYVVYEKAI